MRQSLPFTMERKQIPADSISIYPSQGAKVYPRVEGRFPEWVDDACPDCKTSWSPVFVDTQWTLVASDPLHHPIDDSITVNLSLPGLLAATCACPPTSNLRVFPEDFEIIKEETRGHLQAAGLDFAPEQYSASRPTKVSSEVIDRLRRSDNPAHSA